MYVSSKFIYAVYIYVCVRVCVCVCVGMYYVYM